MIIVRLVTSSSLKSSAFRMFSVHVSTKTGVFKFVLKFVERFREALFSVQNFFRFVWTVGLSVKIKLHFFQIFPLFNLDELLGELKKFEKRGKFKSDQFCFIVDFYSGFFHSFSLLYNDHGRVSNSVISPNCLNECLPHMQYSLYIILKIKTTSKYTTLHHNPVELLATEWVRQNYNSGRHFELTFDKPCNETP